MTGTRPLLDAARLGPAMGAGIVTSPERSQDGVRSSPPPTLAVQQHRRLESASMSHGGRIRDPVHGYVRFTRVERRLIDDALVQRLRYVGQAGLSHLVFPEVRTPRFSHSLGVMHLSTRFLSAALENADPGLRRSMEALMETAVSDATAGYPPAVTEVVRALTEDGLRSATAVSDDARAQALLLEQGLRLAGLVHDLGHLPFSHDFEYAVDRLFEQHRSEALSRFPALTGEGNLAIHERVGYRLATTLIRKIFDAVPDRFEADLARTSFAIAERILMAEPPADPGLAVAQQEALDTDALWWWLHSLMAGEIDVDRCDYLLRDARNYGFEFASYDLDRLADHLTVVRPRADRNLLETAVLPQGVSAAESFYLARYRAYAWGPFHHKVSQIAAALQQSIIHVLSPIFSDRGHDELRQFLADVEAVAADGRGRLHEDAPDLLDRLRLYDDGWLMRHIREAALAQRDAVAQPWLDLVCWRTRGPKSLWKRSVEFPGDLRAFNAGLPDLNDPDGAASWQAGVDELAREGVLIIRHRFSPYGREPGSKQSLLKVADPYGKLRSLTEVSHSTAALPDIWNADVQVFAAAASEMPPRPAAEVVQRLQRALDEQGVRA